MPISSRPRGRYVRVEPEQVGRIVTPLELAEAIEISAVRAADAVRALVAGTEIHVEALGERLDAFPAGFHPLTRRVGIRGRIPESGEQHLVRGAAVPVRRGLRFHARDRAA